MRPGMRSEPLRLGRDASVLARRPHASGAADSARARLRRSAVRAEPPGALLGAGRPAGRALRVLPKRRMPLGVLPPLAVIGPNPTSARPAPAVDKSLDMQRTAGSVNALPDSQQTKALEMKRAIPASRPIYQGCPPLYYRPGPDCIEQAPEE